jgi:hypothetical protein
MTAEDREKLASDIQQSATMRELVRAELLAGADFSDFYKAWLQVEAFDLTIARKIRVLRPH